jgi:hypothetical protein
MGGSSTPADTTATTTRDLPVEAKPYADALMRAGFGLAQSPYQAYAGMEVAALNQAQQTSLGMQQGRALTGAPDAHAARSFITNSLGGDGANNPYMGQNAQAGTNSLAGVDNPYLTSIINQTGNDISRQYANGTAAQNDGMFAMSGAFGGSAHQNQTANNEAGLANSLAQNANNLRFQDYNQQVGLAETQAGRNQSMNQFNAQRGGDLWQQGFSNRAGLIPGAFQGANQDYLDAAQMREAGDYQGRYTQGLLDNAHANWMTEQNHPYQQLQTAAQTLGAAIGNSGASISRQQGGTTGGSWMRDAAGLGLLGLGLTR